MTAMTDDEGVGRNDSGLVLTVYLRDHFAGSTAGLTLVRRCRRDNAGTALDDVLATIETEIDDTAGPCRR